MQLGLEESGGESAVDFAEYDILLKKLTRPNVAVDQISSLA